ncbi:MAG: hypothetical protein FJ100_00585 [Deltaproteobacteria bacterium]|nr:hypothetical protein [Deltaproteobacteria bacterium]
MRHRTRNSGRWTLATVTLAGAIAAWTPTSAQAAKPAAATAEAESIAETAARRYKSGDFELAAQLYDRAYELARRPALLFNAARAWDRAGRFREALQRYEACAAVETDAGAREEARLRAARLRDHVAAQRPVDVAPAPPAAVPPPQPAAPAPTSPASASPTPTPKPQAPTPGREAAPQESAPPAVAAPAVVAPTPRPLRGPWVLAAMGGAVAVGGGIALGLAVADDGALQGDTDRRNDDGWVTGTTQRSAFERADAIGRRKTWAAAATGAGGALALAGLLWWMGSGDEATRPRVHVAAWPEGLALAGWF